jgi:hypothetical protein
MSDDASHSDPPAEVPVPIDDLVETIRLQNGQSSPELKTLGKQCHAEMTFRKSW